MSSRDLNQHNLAEDAVHTAAAEFADVLTQAVMARLRETQLLRPQQRFFSKSALAEYLGVSERTVKTLRSRGLPARKIGRALYFDLAEVTRFIDAEGTP
jgi:hypothetical protein